MGMGADFEEAVRRRGSYYDLPERCMCCAAISALLTLASSLVEDDEYASRKRPQPKQGPDAGTPTHASSSPTFHADPAAAKLEASCAFSLAPPVLASYGPEGANAVSSTAVDATAAASGAGS